MINIKKLKLEVSKLGHITNTYIIYDDEKNAVVIDPADEAQKIIDFIVKNNLSVKYIFLTHVHADHIAALQRVSEYTHAKILVNDNDYNKFFDVKASCSDILNVKLPYIDSNLVHRIRESNYSINIGKMEFYILSTPGHTSGSIVIFEKNTNSLFSGDTIFSNSYGRCDLITGSFENMKNSLNIIFDTFDDSVKVFPGHGEEALLKEVKKRIKLLIAIKRG